ncbi:MAG TPA: sulfite exporter TauE/SafE family protein [Acidimicrobiia bacterium]|nr:sulfite exporter TauE/SafE family protein [Acidimicrobiia bacterium]
MTSDTTGTGAGLASLLVVGVLAGLFSGILGVGGGIVMVPLMVGILHFDQHRAHATSLAAIVLIAISGVVRFAIAGEVEWAVGLALGLGGVVGSTVGAHMMNRMSPLTLRIVFGLIMVVAGLRMAFAGDPGLGEQPAAVLGAIIGVAIGLAAGVASGVAGIGGGVIMVPAMVFLLGLPQHAAEGTSLLAILFTAVAGTRVNLKHDRVHLREAAIIGAGGIILALVGASIALAMSADSLTQVFGVFVTLVGIRMIILAYRGQRGPVAEE